MILACIVGIPLALVAMAFFYRSRPSARSATPAPVPAHKADEALRRPLMGEWQSSRWGLTLRFGADSVEFTRGEQTVQVRYEADAAGKVTFRVPRTGVSISAHMGEDGALRVSCSDLPGVVITMQRN